jgi:hypothetical protein
LWQGKDIIGLAETGSGKTGAFALPILHALLENPQKLYALVLTPTRELAFQVALFSYYIPVFWIRDILIRIRILLLSSVAFKKPTKNNLFSQVFLLSIYCRNI